MRIELGEIILSTIQQVGNKTNGEGIAFANSLSDINESFEFIKLLVKNTFKFKRLSHFDFVESLHLNPVYTFVSKIFEDKNCFVKQSNNLVRYLYDQSLHPKIMNGEFYVFYIANCIVDKEQTDAILMLKSEKKDTFLTVYNEGDILSAKPNIGLGIKHIDKGCLVFNKAKEDGYIINVVDNNSGKDAHYWTDSFLHVVNYNDDYSSTIQIADIVGGVIRKMQKEKPEQSVELAKIACRTTQLLKVANKFTTSQLTYMLSDSDETKIKFEEYMTDCEHTNGTFPNIFQTSPNAINRKAITRMNVLKLGTDFELKLLNPHGEIEIGYDDERDMKFYKLYFK